MDIKGFIENSLIEWPGKLAAVVFLPGCNMRCHYCHAAHLVLNPERHESIEREQVFDCLRRLKGWLDGVVITGGEPTLHGDDLVELIEQIRAMGLKTMIETNGTRPEMLGRLLRDGLLDCVAMDVKAPLDGAAYQRVAGMEVDIEDIRASIRLVLESGLEHEFRITLVPGLVGEDELKQIGPEITGAKSIALQNVKPHLCMDEELRTRRAYMPEQMDRLGRLMRRYAQNVIVRGREHGLEADDAELAPPKMS
jgi:pyruvate formate lyase activating enzyme